MRKTAFPPVAAADAKILILGSMPGEESLQRGEYYAHPRNSFWRIMGQLFGFAPDLPYPQRLEQLLKNRIALWDVLSACTRDGSLDADIKSPEPNDLLSFLREHPQIGAIYCNGQTAYKFLVRNLPQGKDFLLPITVLPSTSPAHASISPIKKFEKWTIIKG